MLNPENQPAYRLTPLRSRKFRVLELEGFIVEFRGEASLDELIFHQPNGLFVARLLPALIPAPTDMGRSTITNIGSKDQEGTVPTRFGSREQLQGCVAKFDAGRHPVPAQSHNPTCPRYAITEEPQSVYTCHCTACQRLTSSAFSMGLVVAEAAFRLSGVEPKALQRVADSGRVNTRLVCPECGSWICSLPRDGFVRVRAGSLDDTSRLRPTRHIWTRSKQPWITFAAGDEIFEAQPPA